MRFVILLALLLHPFSTLLATPVLFPLSQMFNGGLYTKPFTLQPAQSWLTDGSNAFVGSSITVTPSGGTNPIVQAAPNDYLVTFSDATYPWHIRVPNTTVQQSALNLSIGPMPTFLVTATTYYSPVFTTSPATATNAIAQYNFTNQQFGWVFNGWFSSGTNPVTLPTSSTTSQVASVASIIVPKIMTYQSNGVPIFYILSGQNAAAGAVFATSTNLTSWTTVPANTIAWIRQWSPTVFEGPNNDLHYLCGRPDYGGQVWCVDLPNPYDLTQWSNARQLVGVTNGTTANSPGGGLCVWNPPDRLWYVFTTTDDTSTGINYIYTNSALTSTGWGRAGLSGVLGSGVSMVTINGTNILYYSYGGWYAKGTPGNLLTWSAPIAINAGSLNEGGLFAAGLNTSNNYTVSAATNIFASSTFSNSQVIARDLTAGYASLNNVVADNMFVANLSSQGGLSAAGGMVLAGSFTDNPASVYGPMQGDFIYNGTIQDAAGDSLSNGTVWDAYGDSMSLGTVTGLTKVTDGTGDYMSGGRIQDSTGDYMQSGVIGGQTIKASVGFFGPLASTNITGGLNMIVTNMWSPTITNRLYFTNGILVKFTSP